jgi:branched-subunit amino acid aminotransferase/4-amino-4-deoxychorismate lyase
MIWTADNGVSTDEAVRVPASDRVFEHGLGLFESMRTWAGLPSTLELHLNRLRNSAKALQIPLESDQLPSVQAVETLRHACGFAHDDTRLRIVLTGGESDSSRSHCWLRIDPLPKPIGPDGAVVGFGAFRVDEADVLTRHKTLNYWARRIAMARARAVGADERLTFTADGRVWEALYSNVFVVRDGALWTPPLDGPILPGIMRALTIAQAGRLGIAVHEVELNLNTLERADGMFLTNAVRGIVPVGRLFDRTLDSLDPLIIRLRSRLRDQLERGEIH